MESHGRGIPLGVMIHHYQRGKLNESVEQEEEGVRGMYVVGTAMAEKEQLKVEGVSASVNAMEAKHKIAKTGSTLR